MELVAYDDIPPRLQPELESYDHCLDCGTTIDASARFPLSSGTERETGAFETDVTVRCPQCESWRIQRRLADGEIYHQRAASNYRFVLEKPTVPGDVPRAVVVGTDPVKFSYEPTGRSVTVSDTKHYVIELGAALPVQETDNEGVFEAVTGQEYFEEPRVRSSKGSWQVRSD